MEDTSIIEQPLVQEQTPVQTPPPTGGGEPTYTQKVYSALKDNLQGFNKTPDEFNKAMQDPAYAARAYQALKDNLNGFTKTQDEFYSAVGLKKAGGAGSPLSSTSGLPPNVSSASIGYTGNTPQTSQLPVTPITDPNLRQQVAQKARTPAEAEIEQYRNSLSPDQLQSLDRLGQYQPNDGTISQYKAPTFSQKAAYELKSIAGSVNKGIANAVIAPLYHYGNKIGLVDDAEKARVLGLIHTSDKETFGISPDALQGDPNSPIHNTINQFAFMAPALITAEGTGGASFGLQTAGQAAVNVQEMKDKGVKFDNHSDDLYILGSGIIGTALGRGSLGKVFNSFGNVTKDRVVSGLTAEVIKDLAEKGEKATAQDITNAFLSKAQTFADKVGQTGLTALQQYAKVGTELSAANAATFGTKKLANALSGDEPFKDATGQDFVQGVSEPFGLDKDAQGNPLTALGNMATSPAGMFGAIGGAGEALGMLGHNPNPTIERLQSDNSPENVQAIKQELVQQGQAKGWTDEEVQNAQKGVDMLSNTVGKLPKGLNPEKVQKGVSIIMGRNELQDQLAQMQDERAKLDPSITDVPNPQEELIQNKIDQANDKIKGLVTGNVPTYSKGTDANGDEGIFYKTVGGVKEEIPQSRYDLEVMERDAKKKSPEPETTVENKTEVQEEPQKGEQNNAIQEQGTGEVGIRQPQAVGEGVGGQDQPIEPTQQGEQPNVSSENAQPKEEILNHQEADAKHIQEETNPDKIALRYHSEENYPDTTEKAIIDYLGNSKINESDYNRYGDRNRLDAEKRKRWIDSKNSDDTGLDVHAEALSHELGTQVTPQDFIDVIDKYKGRDDFNEKNKTDTQKLLEQRYEELTGKKLTPNRAYKAYLSNLTEKEHAEANDLLSEHGLTTKDFTDEQGSETGKVVDSNEETSRTSPNDGTGNDGENTGSEKSKETVSSKKESIKEQADKVNVELDDNKKGVRSKEIVEAEADKALKDGYDVHELVRKIKDEKYVATDTENAILSKHIASRADEIVDLNKKIEDGAATMSQEKLDDLTAKRDAALKDFQDVANATDQTRSDAGRALQSGKFKLNNNYSLEALIKNERRLNDNKPLSEQQLADVNKRYAELEKANTEYEKRLKESQDEISRLKAEKSISRTRTRSVAKTHEQFVAERKKIAEDFSKKLADMRKSGQLNDVGTATAQFLKAAAPYVGGMVRSLAHEGITELGEVVRRIRDELDLNELSTREIHDLISGKYNEPVTKSDLQGKVNRLKNEAELLSQIEDAENKVRKLPEAKKKVVNERIDGLRKRLKELDKENGLYDEKNAQQSKERLQKEINDIKGKISRKEFDKPEKNPPPDETPEVRDLRRKRDALRHEYEVDVARRELDKRSNLEKAKDSLLNFASLPRAIKATLDFSAVLRQGLIPTVAHPLTALKALKTMFGQTFSEKKYHDWFSDLKNSPQYDLIKASGLYISEKNNPELLAREEQFTSNLLEKAPLGIGKVHQAAERAYTGYLNAIRTGVFIDGAQQLERQGYTFKNNPKAFQDVATVVNVLSGRGNIPDWLGGKQPAVLSNLLFSPRFMAARIHTFYLWGDPRLSRGAKVLAAKDIGKTLALAGTILGLAKASGASVNLDQRSSDFLKIRDGDTRYDILGGLGQYVVFLSQQITGKKLPTSGKGMEDLTSGGYGKPTRLTVAGNFLRGKLNPLLGIGVNLMDSKDMVGNPYDISSVPQEFVPLPATDVYDAYKVGGITNALKVLVPSQFGVGVNSYKIIKKPPHHKH